MEITGRIKLIGEVQTFGANGFRKRETVITTDEQYPQQILVEFTQDKCDLLNNFKINDQVTISINIRGREWINPEGVAKYFNSINGWRIQGTQAAQPTSMSGQEMPPMPNATPASDAFGDNDEDLPF